MMRLSLLLLWLIPSWLFANDASVQRPARELGLSGYQEDLIARDMPLSTLTLSPDARIVYILGKTHLWLWRAEEKSLHRIKVPHSPKEGACRDLVALEKERTALFCDNAVYLVALDPLQLLRLKAPAPGETHGFGATKDSLYWLHDSGVFAINLDKPALRRVFGPGLFKKGDQARFDGARNAVWIAREGLLLKKTLKDGDVKSDLVHKAGEDFLGLEIENEEAWAHTSRTVLRFDAQGNLRGVIPVEGRRGLADAWIAPRQHVYLFEDGLLEVYDLAGKVRRAYRLEKNWEHAAHLASQGPLAAFLRDGQPTLFLLE